MAFIDDDDDPYLYEDDDPSDPEPDEPDWGADEPVSWWRRHVMWRWYDLRGWWRRRRYAARYDDEPPF